ncbi:MAG: MBL fold metallo-hydrolase [Thermoguttaceae bacterium]|nr:MBL fold metallo-hydrolase [Thermoguttaceae bacterium]
MLINQPPASLADGLWMLGTAAYPIYLCRDGDEAAIFEGGIGAVASLVARQLSDLGIAGKMVTQVIVTHAHPDHVMAVPRFRAVFPEVRVVASEIAAKTLAAEKAVTFFHQIDEALFGSLVAMGRIGPDDRPAALAEKQIAVDRVVREGDAVAIGARSFEVLATPGHSECSLSFFDRASRALVISDATGFYVPQRETWWPNYFAGYAAYLASMQRLAALDAGVLCLSHNGAVRGAQSVRDYFARAIAATEAYHRRIIEQIRAGKAAGELAGELGREAHDLAPVLPVDFFQKNCSLLIKQSLKHEGLAAEK